MTAPSNSPDRGRGRHSLVAAVIVGVAAALTAAVVLNEQHPGAAATAAADMATTPQSAAIDRTGPTVTHRDPSLPAAGAFERDSAGSSEVAPTF